MKNKLRLRDLRGKSLAVDANNVLHQFLALIRTRTTSLLTGPNGTVTSHLVGLLYRTAHLISEYHITPVFIFDGKPPILKRGEIEKHYFALVYGKIKDKKGIINKAITISKNGKRKALLDKKSKSAITEYKVIKEFQVKNQWFSLLEVIPKTGRTHQIRVHLSSIGHPILGDKKYKFKRTPQIPELKRQFLHAYYLKIKLPSGILKSFASPLPTDLINSLKWLEKKSKD